MRLSLVNKVAVNVHVESFGRLDRSEILHVTYLRPRPVRVALVAGPS